MNCSIFRKRLNDYIEGCISYDLKDAMEKHLKDCKACREVYTDEVFIDRVISKNVSCDNVRFSSIASDVMDNIDRTKYQKPSGIKTLLFIKEHLAIYTTIAALIAISIIVAPAYFNKVNEIPLKPYSQTVVQPETKKINGDVTDSEEIETNKVKKKYAPEFIRSAYVKEPKSFTPWEKSINHKYEACVEGKGVDGTKEGIASIIVKIVSSGEMMRFQLNQDTNTRSNTPKAIEWWDDEKIMVVFGFGYGTNVPGGDLYILNVETGSFTPAYEIKDKRNQIIDVVKVGDDLELNMHIYDDMKWSTSHKEKWIIPSFDITLNKEMEVQNAEGEKINNIGGMK